MGSKPSAQKKDYASAVATSVQQPDYYEVLGVPSDADTETIRRAFRSLARGCHPDVSSDPQAGERFRELAEAYEVLSNPETRRLYDSSGYRQLFDAGLSQRLWDELFRSSVSSGSPSTPATRGADVSTELTIEAFEADAGTVQQILIAYEQTCQACSGDGRQRGATPEVCPSCGGEGRVKRSSSHEAGHLLQLETCFECGGAGRLVREPCATCTGTGRVTAQRPLKVRIPPGVDDGQRIRVSGEGAPGTGGGQPGDTYITLHVTQPPSDSSLIRYGAAAACLFAIAFLVFVLFFS